jgi:hypothetical protein
MPKNVHKLSKISSRLKKIRRWWYKKRIKYDLEIKKRVISPFFNVFCIVVYHGKKFRENGFSRKKFSRKYFFVVLTQKFAHKIFAKIYFVKLWRKNCRKNFCAIFFAEIFFFIFHEIIFVWVWRKKFSRKILRKNFSVNFFVRVSRNIFSRKFCAQIKISRNFAEKFLN